MRKVLLLLCVPFMVLGQMKDAVHFWGVSEKCNLEGDRESSINVLLESIENYKKEESTHVYDLAVSFCNLGVRYQTYGRWDESAFAYLKSIEYLQQAVIRQTKVDCLV